MNRERGVSFEPVLDTVFGYLCVLSIGKRCAPFGVIVVLMLSLVTLKSAGHGILAVKSE